MGAVPVGRHAKRPDMRVHGRNWGEKGTPVVLLTIEIPDNLVLLSDFDYWHCVLNDGEIIFPIDDSAGISLKKKTGKAGKIFLISAALLKVKYIPILVPRQNYVGNKRKWVKKS